MTRRITSCAIAAALGSLCLASAAGATPTQLLLSQSAAFSLLGHSCGGIQERVYATGFAADGYPAGDVYMQTRCGGSGRGGGYKTTTYSAWANATWSWFGETRSFAKLEGAAEENTTFSAEDSHGDRIYNSGTAAYLETGEPPLQPPAAPTGTSASVSLYEGGESEYLRMQVSWTPDPETAALISSSTVTAMPVAAGPPTLSTSVSGSSTSAFLAPVAPNTTYRVTVTSTDAEGTSQESSPIEITTPNEDGVGGGGGTGAAEICEQNSGSIKLTPGLTETPHVQEIAVKGGLKLCDGPAEPAEATYAAHLLTTEEVTCSTLDSLSAEPTTSAVSFLVKWLPLGSGKSVGQLLLPLSEAGGSFQGTLEGGPFAGSHAVFASSLWESFKGAATCGVPSPKGVVKPVKSGTFATSAVEIG
ncbi:MAG TPA: fibronectin type III domain-containing protein [Solirubrobacteraceae bacterium]|nr:fibronectin type III domain-containing protein [Solirubrobacteraceae bacterium]